MSTLSTYGNAPGLSERQQLMFPDVVAGVAKEGPFYDTPVPRMTGEPKGDDLQTVWHDTQYREAVDTLRATRAGQRAVKARQLAGVGGYADLPRPVTLQKYANPSWGNFQSIYPGHEMPEAGTPWMLSHAWAHGGAGLEGGILNAEPVYAWGKDLIDSRMNQLAKIDEAEAIGFDSTVPSAYGKPATLPSDEDVVELDNLFMAAIASFSKGVATDIGAQEISKMIKLLLKLTPIATIDQLNNWLQQVQDINVLISGGEQEFGVLDRMYSDANQLFANEQSKADAAYFDKYGTVFSLLSQFIQGAISTVDRSTQERKDFLTALFKSLHLTKVVPYIDRALNVTNRYAVDDLGGIDRDDEEQDVISGFDAPDDEFSRDTRGNDGGDDDDAPPPPDVPLPRGVSYKPHVRPRAPGPLPVYAYTRPDAEAAAEAAARGKAPASFAGEIRDIRRRLQGIMFDAAHADEKIDDEDYRAMRRATLGAEGKSDASSTASTIMPSRGKSRASSDTQSSAPSRQSDLSAWIRNWKEYKDLEKTIGPSSTASSAASTSSSATGKRGRPKGSKNKPK